MQYLPKSFSVIDNSFPHPQLAQYIVSPLKSGKSIMGWYVTIGIGGNKISLDGGLFFLYILL